MKRSFIYLGVGVALVSLTAFVYRKKNQIERVVDTLQFKIKSIRNFDVSLQDLSLDLDIVAVNPTKEHLYVNTGFIKASVLRVYEKKTGKLLAFSNLKTSTINIPSGGFFQLPPAHIKIPLLTGGQMMLTHFLGNKEAVKDFTKQLNFELDLKAFGTTKTIKF
ncbi:hypothetical protein [uncultured Tenacibaculum sp.]|uniref:hypothetical protein n=1 Tax=uncultured Tenacibaculum sp. TaxID=174713 RepID=UPI00262E6AFE|nr:hypothetical protein [uncultured Tenacibaculum sp.]